MTGPTEHLDRDDAALLLYLAGELDPRERGELERRLATEDDLRRRLEAMGGLCDSAVAHLAALDRADGTTTGRHAAGVRQASRAIRQWTAQRLAPRPQAMRTGQGALLPAWAWPITAAAVILVAFMAWWGNRPDAASPGRQQIVSNQGRDRDSGTGTEADDPVATLLTLSLQQSLRMDAEAHELDEAFEMLASIPDGSGDAAADIFYSGPDSDEEVW